MATEKELLLTLIRKYGGEWQEISTARLGDYSQTVRTPTPGVYWARQINGKVIEVYNTAKAPPTFDLHVRIATRSRLQSKKWELIEILEDYLTPADGGQIAYHVSQHQFMGGDMGMWDRRQIIQFSCLVSDAANFEIAIFGGLALTNNGLQLTGNQFIGLSSYQPSAGAVFVTVEYDDDGVLSIHEGDVFSSPLIANETHIPIPAVGKYPLYAVLLHEGQTELSNGDIRPIMPLPHLPPGSGTQIHDAAAETTIADGDEFGFWDISANLLKKITWTNIKATLKTYLDTFYAALSHTHNYAAADHTHEISGGHLHGLARWNGANGQAIFELPDIWESIETLTLDGLEEDPLRYTLSADGSQIIFDSGLSAAMTVTANGVVVAI